MATTVDSFIDKKTISVSNKRQITIPLKFYRHLDLDNEIECSLEKGAIVLRPIKKDTTEFSVEILKDLIDEGYSGDDLIEQFELKNKNIKKAITNILEEADSIAAGEIPAADLDDIFGSTD